MCVMTRWHIPGALSRVPRPVPLSVVLASVLLFLSSLLWAVVVPGFQAPDELMHANSVLRVAEGGGWPRPTDARVEDELFDAWELAGGTCSSSSFRSPSSSPPEWSAWPGWSGCRHDGSCPPWPCPEPASPCSASSSG